MAARQTAPSRVRDAPTTSGQCRRRVCAMRKPVAAPAVEATPEERTRRKPEVVAEVRRTPWKKRGLGEGLGRVGWREEKRGLTR
jgi:hypothetical protein